MSQKLQETRSEKYLFPKLVKGRGHVKFKVRNFADTKYICVCEREHKRVYLLFVQFFNKVIFIAIVL